MGTLFPPGPRATAAVLALVLCAADGRTARADLITNGGFEAGFAGWTRADQLGSEGTFFLHTGTASPVAGDPVPAPPGGLRAAMTDAFGPGAHVLYQDFTVPHSAVAAQLRFDVFVGNRASAFFDPNTLDFATPALNQQARVDVLRPGADPFSTSPGDVLQTVFRTRPGDPLVFGFSTITADLTAVFAANPGQTLRLRFAETDNVFTFQFGVDNVSLDTAPLPEPSTLAAFGLCAAAGFVRYRRRPRVS